jgi:1-phosphofructokinase
VSAPRVVIFGPHPLLTVTLERHDRIDDDVHLHIGGQGVWVARMAAELGAHPVLCGFVGGESGVVAEALLERLGGERRLVQTSAPTGCYVSNGTPVLVDLSSPRLDSALEGGPDLVKLNDWELAEFVRGPVGSVEEMRSAAASLLDGGAGRVLVTRGGDSAFVFAPSETWELTPPHLEQGAREGCGDSMMGAIAAAWASGAPWTDALLDGAAAGAANFLRHGLGTGARAVVEDLRRGVSLVRVEPVSAP